MDPAKRIRAHFADGAELQREAAETLPPQIARAANVMTECLFGDGRILACGDGASASDAQQFCALLGGRFERERPELAAIALGADAASVAAIADGYAYESVLARQLRALGARGDVLLAISALGDSPGLAAAVGAARERDMRVVALTGKGGGRLRELLGEGDVHVSVPHARPARIREVHRLVIHCLCDAIDHTLLGDDD
jgi:D-sedoheptulose 7-phosphate isomerase